jgi:hypothetical protein
MTMPECVDHEARDTIRSVRDEHDTNIGKVMREIGKLHEHIDHVRRFLGAPAWGPKPEANGHHEQSPSGSDLARFATEFVTGSGSKPSNPVKAMVYKWTGKQVWSGLKLAGLAALGFAGHWVFATLWTAAHH